MPFSFLLELVFDLVTWLKTQTSSYARCKESLKILNRRMSAGLFT